MRRALLAGAGLDDPMGDAVNRVPVVVTPDDDARTVVELMERNDVSQVPVVDDQGILVGVHLMRVIVGEALDEAIPGVGDHGVGDGGGGGGLP